ncbi:iron-containing alcohol dehydrogenase family protein [Candidatus Hakubella thermalkaliphila]|uniref:iron-containing alcohol dehydrogenase family protein n=1 Tax=Candidatus Hakubella thermalkaliphila TaxID=2754717 RepID=UPI001593EC75|nr:iron-containing alcohol dehydrogenase [Candidatus Hakubella thermalkaliphila]
MSGLLTEYFLPPKIIMGNHSLDRVGDEARKYGSRVMLVCGQRAMRESGTLQKCQSLLESKDLEVILFDQVKGEPDLDLVREGLTLAREEKVEVVIGLGGGSAIDVAKAVAGLFYLEGEVEEYHDGRKIEGPGIAFMAIPTTAGTGAEVTNNSVLTNQKTSLKQSIRSPLWYARCVIVDPTLTLSIPPAVTAATGADALVQAIEAYSSSRAQPITDALAARAIQLLGANLARVYKNGQNLKARKDMLVGSVLAGMALSNAGLGAIHALAHPIGVQLDLPHGLVCGILLPSVMEHNLECAQEKYAQIAGLLGVDIVGSSPWEAAQLAIQKVKAVLKEVEIPEDFRGFDRRALNYPEIISYALSSNSLKYNPRKMEAEDLKEILDEVM